MNYEDEKLERLAEIEGYDDTDQMLNANMWDSIVPGICMNATCDYTTPVEPDQSRGFCEVCRTKTVKSSNVLAGII